MVYQEEKAYSSLQDERKILQKQAQFWEGERQSKGLAE